MLGLAAENAERCVWCETADDGWNRDGLAFGERREGLVNFDGELLVRLGLRFRHGLVLPFMVVQGLVLLPSARLSIYVGRTEWCWTVGLSLSF